MSNLKVEPYFTPAGYVDFPFTYVYDATGLTDGQTYMNIQKQLAGDADFILRAIVGAPTVLDTGANGGKFNYKNASGSYAVQAPIVMSNVYSVVPEKYYPRDASIVFDLYNVSRDSRACGGNPIKSSYIGFQGVKRFALGQGYAIRETPYRYKEKRYSFEYPLTVSVGRYTVLGGNIQTAPFRQVVPMDDYDFELLQIVISQDGVSGALQTADFQVMLYDANMHQLSDVPLNQGYINSGKPSPSAAPQYTAVMPVPSLVYPAGGNVVFDVSSLLCANEAPITYNVSLKGVWRIPC